MTSAPPPVVSGELHGEAAPPLPQPRYVRLGLLGRGGMGEVWLGWDAWLQRNVALKVPHATPGAEQALLREALLAARLDHPAIVTIVDLTHEDGQTTFVMRLERGQPLADRLGRTTSPGGTGAPGGSPAATSAGDANRRADRGPAPTRRRALVLRALRLAADAVAHAHARGVVHRDLSPSNLLVGERGEVSVIDWGVAASIGDQQAPTRVGTPGFTAPEQAAGAPPHPTADVWALGALLRAALQEDAAPELRAIADRAQQADPARRYPHAGALADDLAAWEDGRLVAAYAYRPTEVLLRLVRAWRRPLALAAAVLVLLLAQAARYTASLRREERRAVAAEVDARARLADARAGQALAAWRVGDEVEARRLAADALRAAPQPLARGLLLATELAPAPETLRTLPLGPCVRWLLPGDGAVAVCAGDDTTPVHPLDAPAWTFPRNVVDARLVAGVLTLHDHLRSLWQLDPRTGAVLGHTPGESALRHPTLPWRMDADGASLLEPGLTRRPCPATVISLTDDGAAGVWAACIDGSVRYNGETLVRPPSLDVIKNLQRAGGELWGATHDGLVMRLTGRPAQLDLGEPVRALLPGPGLLLVHGRQGRLRLLDPATAGWRLDLPGGASAVALNADGLLRRIDGEQLSEVRLPAAVPRLAWRNAHGISTLAWEPDSVHLRVGDGAGNLHRVDTSGAEPDRAERWQERVLKAVDVGPGGHVVATAAGPPGARVWEPDGAPRAVQFEGERRVVMLADGTWVGATYGGLVLHHGADDRVVLEAPSVNDLAADPSRAHLAAATESGVWTWSPGGPPELALPGSWAVVAVSPTGVAAARGAEVAVRDLAPWSAPAPVTDLAWLPDGRLVLGLQDGALLITEADGAAVASLPLHADRVGAIAVSPDGARIASGGWDGVVRVLAAP